MERRFAITGGGTSGHINPALAIAGILERRYQAMGDTVKIIFTGRADGLEGELVPKAGYEFRNITAKAFPTKPTPAVVSAVRALRAGQRQCEAIIDEFKPEAVISTGGYVSGPLLSAARKRKVPIMIHEANAFPGRANKIMSKGALVMTGFPNQEDTFAKAFKVVYTGNPVRAVMFGRDYDKSREELGIKDGTKLVFAMGGSLGAQTITKFILSCARDPEFKDVRFVLSVGKHNAVSISDEDRNLPNLEIMDYINNPEVYLSGSDVCILRAGAVTCAEITATGACSIMIPYPHAAHDHQTYNANSIASKGGGIVMSDEECCNGDVVPVLKELLSDDDRRLQIRTIARSLAVPDTDDRIFDAINEALGAQN